MSSNAAANTNKPSPAAAAAATPESSSKATPSISTSSLPLLASIGAAGAQQPQPQPSTTALGTTTAAAATASNTTTATTAVVGVGSMSWEPVRQRLLGTDLNDAYLAAQELVRHGSSSSSSSTGSSGEPKTTKSNLAELVHSTLDFPLLLAALLPAFSSLLTTRTRPSADIDSTEYKLRHLILDIMSTFPCNEILRPHAPHVIVICEEGVLFAYDVEENALTACRIIFDLYKTFRTLPLDYIQPFLDFVVTSYRNLPTAVRTNFQLSSLTMTTTTSSSSPQPPQQQQQQQAPKPTLATTTATATATVAATGSTTAATATATATTTTTATPATAAKGKASTDAGGPQDMDIVDDPSKPKAVDDESPGPVVAPSPSLPSITSSSSSLFTSPTITTITTTTSASATSPTIQQQNRPLIRANMSFRVLTECPLIVMLMFQLYPKFLKTNIPIMVKVMTEALALRPVPITTLFPKTSTTTKSAAATTSKATQGGANNKSDNQQQQQQQRRFYYSRVRELVAAQAKTLSFLTYLLRGFAAELQPYQDKLATNVVALMQTCPRESIGTRKELLVATRHLLNSDFRQGFFRHVEVLLDERVLMGSMSSSSSSSSLSSYNSSSSSPTSAASSHVRFSDQALLRPLAYTTLSDLVQHVRSMLTMPQMSRVVSIFSRILHDSSNNVLPLSTQYAAVRTLLSVLDCIYHNNKDVHPASPQLGRDMLVRILSTLVDKLSSLVQYFPIVLRAEQERDESCSSIKKQQQQQSSSASNDYFAIMYDPSTPPDTIRDVQSMIRAIVVGCKTVIYYTCNYRNQRDKEKQAAAAAAGNTPPPPPPPIPPPPGTNEEVFSAMLKMTNTEVALVDQYISIAIPAISLLKVKSPHHQQQQHDLSLAGGGDKTTVEHHRDALTYFAATFTGLDGYTLHRTLGKRLEFIFQAILDDPVAMVVPRHLLASNPSTSYEVVSMLLNFLVPRMDEMAACWRSPSSQSSSPPTVSVTFLKSSSGWHIDNSSSGEETDPSSVREQLRRASCRPEESQEMLLRKSTALLHLFERVLKSLAAHPDNEAAVRKHLRRIVVVCLRSSMENTDSWPDAYCMLLRYVFRSISAGKFEESYRELLPLIPAVLNGLYKVITACVDPVIRHTAIELCLTIPARLSSLLPHMNLLLRAIIPALDSGSGDLVNLGLRTLEFWVDNLNPEFLYPEISKQVELFTTLMQALSRHLRPAPYPYGLLTLRLLGKLGGKNRQFLREPVPLSGRSDTMDYCLPMTIECSWKTSSKQELGGSSTRIGDVDSLNLPLPLNRCVDMLKCIAVSWPDGETSAEKVYSSSFSALEVPATTSTTTSKEIITWKDSARLWECNLNQVDFEAYSTDVVDQTKKSQANACLCIVQAAVNIFCSNQNDAMEIATRVRRSLGELQAASRLAHSKAACLALLFACIIDSTKDEAWGLLKRLVADVDPKVVASAIAEFLSEPSQKAADVSLKLLDDLVTEGKMVPAVANLLECVIASLCDGCSSNLWGTQTGVQAGICFLMEKQGAVWSKNHEVKLMNAALLSVKSGPRELSIAAAKATCFFIRVCSGLYGSPWKGDDDDGENLLWDDLSVNATEARYVIETKSSSSQPCDEVVQLVIHEVASSQQIVRIAARFLLSRYVIPANSNSLSEHVNLIRRVLFSRSLRLLPLPQQVGVIEGLALVVKLTPTMLALTDQHLLSFLSELLKMCSVADNEMNDPSLKDLSVDKSGMVDALPDQQKSGNPAHASALFFRRESAIKIPGGTFVLPEELPAGIQLRVSAVLLLHSVIRAHPGPFFDAESSTPIGNIRPHIISLMFRSLVSKPTKAVLAAHGALKDVLALSDTKTEEGGPSPQSRLPKELIQTCIRPVLLNLRDFTRLSVPLLRGLSRLLSLLSSWFNKTLGEKLLDHLQKWTEPSRIMALAKWDGEEPLVAAAIVNIFSMLPHASNFVEPLVKTCIKLENTLPVFKTRLTDSPYRKPLARYLNKHPQHAVNFFFQRLKTPIYSELFLSLVQLEESAPLRVFLSNRPSSVMILNVCFERPLAIIRSEKSSSSGLSTRTSLPVHGIGSSVGAEAAAGNGATSMNIEALELQHQGFRLIRTLLEHNSGYFRDHSDIHRAIRWLYRSKGRFLRFQHEDQIPPRFHSESRSLALFLMSNARASFDDLDILFELIRVFLQPSTCDFGFVSRFLRDMVCNVLDFEQKKVVVNRFFALLGGESNEETKVLSIQYLVFPMLFATIASPEKALLIDAALIEKFVNEILFQKGNPVPSGDRLRVELLKMTNMLVDRGATHVEPFRKEIVRFCWGLLKSDDTACKSWAYVVICRVISKFETPVKVTQQVCTTLFRSTQQEGKELVRSGLDLLVPALHERLPRDDFQKAIEQVAQMMLQDATSVAHICQTIVRDPGVFSPFKNRFIGGMLNSLPRLGLPPNCPLESRVLSVDVVELLLEWVDDGGSSPQSVAIDHTKTIANFLVRLRMAIAEPPDGRSSKVDTAAVKLDHRVKHLFEKVLGTWKGTIHPQPLEKVLSKDKPKPSESAMLYSCVEVLSAIIDAGMLDFFTINSGLMNKIVNVCFLNARDDLLLRSRLRSFIGSAGTTPSLTALVAVSLEKILLDAATEQKKVPSNRAYDQTSKAASRSRDKNTSLDDSTVALSYAVFALELIDVLCRKYVDFRRRIGSTILSLAGLLTKNHLLEAAAKQRQGSSSAPRTAASRIMNHTPTKGILEQACLKESSTFAPPGGRGRSTKENAESSDLVHALYFSLAIFENSDIPYLFTQDRKVLVHILSSILDSSDNVLLLMMSTRFVGKWLLSDSTGIPVTVKERNSLLWKLSSFDSRCLADDIAAQPLADLVRHFVTSVSPSVAGDNLVFGRALSACLLHANEPARQEVFSIYLDMRKSPVETQLPDRNVNDAKRNPSCLDVLWRLLHGDYEGLGGRFWVVVFVEALLHRVAIKDNDFLSSMRVLCHGDESLCQMLFEKLLPVVWEQLPDDSTRCRVARAFESLLSRPFHSQFLREGRIHGQGRCTINAVRSFLNVLPLLRPVPVLDTGLLVSLAENYNSWHEVLSLLEKQYVALSLEPSAPEMLSAMRHCYRQLGEESIWMILARESCNWPLSRRALSLDIYGLVNEACDAYGDLVSNVDVESSIEPSDFEMDMWEERWIELQREVCQLQVVSEFANTSSSHRLQLECAWKAQDWNKVRALCASTTLLAAAESGDTAVKMSETLLAVADGKLSDVENLHAQTAQLCLYKWQLLPQLSSGSPAHAGLLHFFHRLVEVRESGQIMVETTAHSNGRTLPDLKNLLSAWRHRLPNDCESLAIWDEVFSWRAHMFSAITKNFHFADPNMLASLHDRPWAAIRMAKTARKQGMRDVSLLLLNKAAEERAMNVSDAYLKLREQILAYFSPESDLERHGGLNLINTTNLSFFDPSQKSELFRLKAMFLASLGGRSKANQAYCHSVQICPMHARAWDSWGGLCSSLGAVAEQQIERTTATGSSETGKEAVAAASKKVSQYLAQAMGCYLEAVQIDTHEWARLHLPKCWWMFTKDGSSPGVICSTFESRAIGLPSWVWLPWLPQLLTSLYRPEGRVMKRILANVARAYPQAVYYPLRAFYLERRDVERTSSASSSSGQHMASVSFAEEIMSLLRRSHASLWSQLEAVLEELIVKFRPSTEEDFLATIMALLERAETQVGSVGKAEEDNITSSCYKTLGRIAVKYFRPVDPASRRQDERAMKTAEFKETYTTAFEKDFQVSVSDSTTELPPPSLSEMLTKLRSWKSRLQEHVLSTPPSMAVRDYSPTLAVFGVGDAPDLWPGSCDPRHASPRTSNREQQFEADPGTSQSSTSSSAAAARKAANNAAGIASVAAAREGVGGDYGGGAACIEIPGQYMPNSSWADTRPSPELHPKLLRLKPRVAVVRRSNQLVRRLGMVGSDGATYHFLLQCAPSYWTRTDERHAQTYFVLDKLLRRGVRTARAHLSIQPNNVIPVAQRLRLLADPESRTSMEEEYELLCAKTDADPCSLSLLFNEEVRSALANKSYAELTVDERSTAERAKRFEIFQRVSTHGDLDPSMLTNALLATMEGPEPFFQFRKAFSQQWGADCLFQHAFSITERTPCRVVFIKSNGRVISPDCQISYNSQGFLDKQVLPFRMTPNVSTLIGFPLDGLFVHSMTAIASVIRENKELLDPILRVLMRDDLVAFFTKSMAKSDSKTQEMEKQLLDRVVKNVSGMQARFAECAPAKPARAQQATNDNATTATTTDDNNNNKPSAPNEDPIDQRVRELLATARDPRDICMMPGSYQGWL